MSVPAVQQRVVVTSFNAADPLSTLAVVEAPVPEPGEGDVLVKITARPVNPADVFSIMGVYPGFAPASLPATPGLEGAGTVVNANGCTSLSIGQRGVVFPSAVTGDGSWQEYVVVKASSFLPVPDSVSDAVAAQFLVNPVTVVGMLDVLSIPAGEYIVQSAAGSVLGRQLITVAKKRGIKTINIIRRAEQAGELLAIGADHVIVSTEVENVAAKVMEITGGKGAFGGIDAVAGEMTAVITGSTRAGGTVLVYGAMSGIAYTGSVVDTLFRNVTTRGFWLNIWLGSLTAERKAEVFGEVLGMLADGSLVPLVGESFPLKDVVAAVAHSQIPARGGKVILVSE